MRVLFITGEYPPMQGGLGDYTYQLGCALQPLEIDVHVFTSLQAADSGPVVHALASGWGWRTRRPLRMVLREVQPDIVHIQYQTAAYGLHPAINLLPHWLRRYSRARCAVTFHDLRAPYLFSKAGPLRQWVNQVLARACDAVIVTNQEDEQLAAQWSLQGRLHRIPIGSNIAPQPPVDFDRDTQRHRWGVGPEELLLVYFGFLNASKGGEALVQILYRLHQRGWPARLLMLGGQVGASDPTNAAYLAQVKMQIDDAGLTDFVQWSGFVAPEEVSANLLAADICLLPYLDGVSFRRGSFLAALAHGCAVVTTTPAVPLLELQDGRDVVLVPPGDAEAAATAVASLWQRPDQRKHLQAAARCLAAQFHWENIAHAHQVLYEQLLPVCRTCGAARSIL